MFGTESFGGKRPAALCVLDGISGPSRDPLPPQVCHRFFSQNPPKQDSFRQKEREAWLHSRFERKLQHKRHALHERRTGMVSSRATGSDWKRRKGEKDLGDGKGWESPMEDAQCGNEGRYGRRM